MYILAIETTGAYASVALADDKTIISKVQGHDRFSHLQNLTPQIEQVLKEGKLAVGDLDAIAVSQGPGSFTGIRIGVSTARALSQVSGRLCVPVPTLEALAMRAAEDAKAADALICPILDARRSQIYGGGYFLENGFPVEKIKAGPYTIDEFMELTAGYEKVLFLGDGADAYGEKIAQIRQDGVDFAELYQDAEQVACLGRKLFEKGIKAAYSDLEPNYMRIPEAERKLKEKQGK